jgi:hypothetical protein
LAGGASARRAPAADQALDDASTQDLLDRRQTAEDAGSALLESIHFLLSAI